MIRKIRNTIEILKICSWCYLVKYVLLVSIAKLKIKPHFFKTVQTSFSIKQLDGNLIYCRPCTSDLVTMKTTFLDRYHLPPMALRNDSVIIDLGCNAGFTMAHYAVLYPNSKIIGVELDKENYFLALRNVERYKQRCSVIKAAIWNEDGSISYSGKSEDSYSINVGRQKFENAGTSESLTLNTLVKRMDLQKIDFIKMDIEGAEVEVLTKNNEWLEFVICMKIEIHDKDNLSTIVNELTRRGFVVTMDDLHWSAIGAIRMETSYS